MSRSEYYQAMRELAQQKRSEYGITTQKITLTLLKKIYNNQGVKIDYWDIPRRKIRAAYFCDDTDSSVLLNRNLPDAQRLFSLAHELKHHFLDREQIKDGKIQCSDYNANQVIEIGAEIFAAEFIYPEKMMLSQIQRMGINKKNCTTTSVVDFKRACSTSISYKFIVKRLEWLGLIKKGEYDKVRFQKLEEKLYGKPFYTQAWFKNYRRNKALVKT